MIDLEHYQRVDKCLSRAGSPEERWSWSVIRAARIVSAPPKPTNNAMDTVAALRGLVDAVEGERNDGKPQCHSFRVRHWLSCAKNALQQPIADFNITQENTMNQKGKT